MNLIEQDLIKQSYRENLVIKTDVLILYFYRSSLLISLLIIVRTSESLLPVSTSLRLRNRDGQNGNAGS